jgi:hypothetical protein
VLNIEISGESDIAASREAGFEEVAHQAKTRKGLFLGETPVGTTTIA